MTNVDFGRLKRTVSELEVQVCMLELKCGELERTNKMHAICIFLLSVSAFLHSLSSFIK